ncbi:MAG: alpha-ketoacid dehydrogenase subunit beta [Dehalococcoidia bacterium]|nr:alpha-ketoacid dehydrogenase subunit beta [Dehalococcoidia bacterium]
MRQLSYVAALNEGLAQALESDDRVLLIGQGVISPWYVGASTKGLCDRFGPARVIDTPVSENAVTGAAIGAALAGMRPIVVHPRMDFMYYAFDQIVNHAANWRQMFGGGSHVPVVFWGIINRGGEQAAQHSQAIHGMFAHVPGLKVVLPSTPHDVKGLLFSAVDDDDPVVFVDDRWLYSEVGEVPEGSYRVPLGSAAIRREGKDITIAATSWMARESLSAAAMLARDGIDAEVIDMRSLKPLDTAALLESVRNTGRFLAVDGGWQSYGASAELCAVVTSGAFNALRSAPARIALPDLPAPAARTLEKAYYPDAARIAREALRIMGLPDRDQREEDA